MGERDLIIIATSVHDYEMQILKTFIEEHGVPAFLRDENMSRGYYGVAVGGVKLEVMRKDVERARKLLHLYQHQIEQDVAWRGLLTAVPTGGPEHGLTMLDQPDGSASTRGAGARPPTPSLSARACPRCGHQGAMEEVPWSGSQLLMIFVLLGVPLLFMRPHVECPGCGERWAR